MNQIRCPLSIASEKHPSLPAIISSKREISYGLLENLVHLAAVKLNEHAIVRGSRVAVIGANCPEYCILILAILRIGAVVCPISDRLPEKGIKEALKNLECKVLVLIDSPQSVFEISGIELILVEELVPHQTDHSAFLAEPEVTLSNPAAIMFTSGTGAMPKAAVLSYGNFYYNALGANERIPFCTNNRWLLSLPLYHVGAWGILFRAITGGGGIVIADKNESIFQAINKYKITHLSLVPTQVNRLLKDGIPKIKGESPVVLIGGGPAPKKLIQKCRKANLNLYRTYGLTEMASQVTTGQSAQGIHSGKILPYREMEIADDGEILVKGMTLFLGYFDKGAAKLPVDSDGWFHTGDIGKLDSQGFLTVIGRKDNMIISGGENIHPEEIELYLMQVPGIESALVVGIMDEEFGRRPAAFVKFSDNCRIKDDEIIKALQKSLPLFKIPRVYLEWPEHLAKNVLKLPRAEFQKLASKERAKNPIRTPEASS